MYSKTPAISIVPLPRFVDKSDIKRRQSMQVLVEPAQLEKTNKRSSIVSGNSKLSASRKKKRKADMPKMIDEVLREEDDETIADAKIESSPEKNVDL